MSKIKKGKVYKEATSYSAEINSLSVANDLIKYAKSIAECLSKLNETKGHIEYIHNVTNDNGDVAFTLNDAIRELGIALAVCIGYANEYEDEANGLVEEDEA